MQISALVLVNFPNWIEALAAAVLAVLTYLTLRILSEYENYTKTIAKASVSQIKTSVNTQKRPYMST
jgi:hypothetical protein